MPYSEDILTKAKGLGVPLPDLRESLKKEPQGWTTIHPLTSRVGESIPQLEFEQFRHPEDRDRLNEVRELAQQQVDDDLGKTGPQWMGRHTRVQARDPEMMRDDSWTIWSSRTDEELDRAAGLEPFLSKLTGDQRIVVRMRYDAQMTQEEIGAVLGITKMAVSLRLATIHKHLHAALLAAYAPETEAA